MNRDVLSGMWKQLSGRAKSMWGELTDDDLTEIQGDREVLAGKLQERYGWTRERVDREIDNFVARSEAELKDLDAEI